jgi:hypothetical protein
VRWVNKQFEMLFLNGILGLGNIPQGVDAMYEDAKKMFLEGKSLRSISILTGFDRKKLSQLLKAEGLIIKSRGISRGISKYRHNTDAFKVIDTEEKAYWLGFLYADGSVYEPRGAMELSLAGKDLSHLKKFRDFISPDMEVKLKMVNEYVSYKIHITSMNLVNDLIDKGCMPAKSLTLKFPTEDQVPRHLVHHFMRGYFDGDGSAYCTHQWVTPQASFEIIGTLEFLTQYMEILMDIGLPFKSEKQFRRHGKAYGLRYHGNGLYKRFENFLYEDATIYLKRKHQPVAHLKSGELLET